MIMGMYNGGESASTKNSRGGLAAGTGQNSGLRERKSPISRAKNAREMGHPGAVKVADYS
jgi:hypothetical protein